MYKIYKKLGYVYGWEYVHKDYDGPEDNRFGFENSPEDCLESIINIEGLDGPPIAITLVRNKNNESIC